MSRTVGMTTQHRQQCLTADETNPVVEGVLPALLSPTAGMGGQGGPGENMTRPPLNLPRHLKVLNTALLLSKRAIVKMTVRS